MPTYEDEDPEGAQESWKLMGTEYKIFERGVFPDNNYTVRRRSEEGSSWLCVPETSYDTLGGAHLAILMDVEDRTY